MFASILDLALVSIDPIQVAVWLFGTVIFYCFIRYCQGATAETDINPVDLFLTLLSGEPFETLPGSDYSFR